MLYWNGQKGRGEGSSSSFHYSTAINIASLLNHLISNYYRIRVFKVRTDNFDKLIPGRLKKSNLTADTKTNYRELYLLVPIHHSTHSSVGGIIA